MGGNLINDETKNHPTLIKLIHYQWVDLSLDNLLVSDDVLDDGTVKIEKVIIIKNEHFFGDIKQLNPLKTIDKNDKPDLRDVGKNQKKDNRY